MSLHPDRLTILTYVENAAGMDRRAIGAHIAGCAECTAVMKDCQQLLVLLSRGDLLKYFSATDSDRTALRAQLMAESDAAAIGRAAADNYFCYLRELPLGARERALMARPEQCTVHLAQRIMEEVEIELNRRPNYALSLISLAERIGAALPDRQSHAITGDVWKHRSNVFRLLGRYDEALDAAEMARAFYSSLPNGAFDVAQAQYTQAAAFFKMTRFEEARQVLDISSATLKGFGESLPLAKTTMLYAAILVEEGNIEGAEERWRGVIPILERLGQHVELARVRANLADCAFRLGKLADAEHDASEALHRYRELGMEAEATRSQWTLGMVALARGASEEGLSILESAAASFEARGMAGDAGFVKLDICEELIRREDWDDAAVIARELVRLFTAARVTLASVDAVDQLRRAVALRGATAAMISNVREFVTVDDPRRLFDPYRTTTP